MCLELSDFGGKALPIGENGGKTREDRGRLSATGDFGRHGHGLLELGHSLDCVR